MAGTSAMHVAGRVMQARLTSCGLHQESGLEELLRRGLDEGAERQERCTLCCDLHVAPPL